MILSDTEIASEVHYGDLEVTPFEESNIQPASLDIRLGNEFRRFTTTQPVNPLEDDPEEITEKYDVPDGETFRIYPGEFALATTKEELELPDYLLANVEGRSSWGRWGIMVHITAGLADPGYGGEITLELKNVNQMPIDLPAGYPICQFVFKTLKEPCKRPYGEERGSQYQGQSGAQPARLHRGESDD